MPARMYRGKAGTWSQPNKRRRARDPEWRDDRRFVDKKLGVNFHGYRHQILVINEVSAADTAGIVKRDSGGKPIVSFDHGRLEVVRRSVDRGYSEARIGAVHYALTHNIAALVTMDCDGEHEQHRI